MSVSTSIGPCVYAMISRCIHYGQRLDTSDFLLWELSFQLLRRKKYVGQVGYTHDIHMIPSSLLAFQGWNSDIQPGHLKVLESLGKNWLITLARDVATQILSIKTPNKQPSSLAKSGVVNVYIIYIYIYVLYFSRSANNVLYTMGLDTINR